MKKASFAQKYHKTTLRVPVLVNVYVFTVTSISQSRATHAVRDMM